MNLMFLVDTLGGGGAEKACLKIASALSDEHHVTIVTIFDEPDVNYSYSERVTVERLKMVIGGSVFSKVRAYRRAYDKLRSLKKKYRIECCISFLETANFFNCICPAGDKKIISIRNYYSLSINTCRKVRNIKAKAASVLADRIVCVSEAVRRDMIAAYRAAPEKTLTICNFAEGPDRNAAAPSGERYQQFQALIRKSSFNFITVGRLSGQKGYTHLIRAFGKVLSAIPDAHLFIMGQGEAEKELKDLARRLGSENSIHFPGFDLQVSKYLECADTYVSSSLYEGMSNAMLEAMAAGLPVIATDCLSGPREVLAPGTDVFAQTGSAEMAAYGILTPVFSRNDAPEEAEEILAEMMIRIAEDPELRKHYSERAVQRAADFSKEKTVGQWRALITDPAGLSGKH